MSPRGPIFPRIEKPPGESVTKAPDDAVPTSAAAAAPAPNAKADGASRAIEVDAFREVDLVVATILAAERVQGADRLLKLDLDLGTERRQVISGIAEHFRPEELPGRQVVLVANLKPAKIRGIESRGMILVAKAGGKMTLLGPSVPIDPGAKIS